MFVVFLFQKRSLLILSDQIFFTKKICVKRKLLIYLTCHHTLLHSFYICSVPTISQDSGSSSHVLLFLLIFLIMPEMKIVRSNTFSNPFRTTLLTYWSSIMTMIMILKIPLANIVAISRMMMMKMKVGTSPKAESFYAIVVFLKR